MGTGRSAVAVVLTGTRSHSRDLLLQLPGRRGRARSLLEAAGVQRQIQIRLSPDDIDRLVAAYQAGSRTAKLAVEFGVHRNTVQRLLRRAVSPNATS